MPNGFAGQLGGGIGLTDLFQNVSSNRRSGLLTVSVNRSSEPLPNDDVAAASEPLRAGIHVAFEAGRVVAVADDAGASLPVIARLVTFGCVDAKEAEQYLARRRRAKRSPLQQLVAGGLVSQDDAVATVAELVTGQICELLECESGHFRFEPSPEAPAGQTDGVGGVGRFAPEVMAFCPSLDVEPLLMEAARRRDESTRLRRSVRSSAEVFVPAADWDELPDEAFAELEEIETLVAERIDAERPVARLMSELGLSWFELAHALAQLLEAGLVRAASVEELLATAAVAGDDAAAVLLLRHVLEREPGHEGARVALAERLAAGGDASSAATEYALLGHTAAAHGDLAAATRWYGEAVATQPNDVGLHERRLQWLARCGEDDEIVGALDGLLAMYFAAGTFERGRELLEVLTDPEAGGGDQARRLSRREDVVALRARCAEGLGDQAGAAALWRRLAESMLRDDEVRALQLLRRAAQCDPADEALQARVRDVASGRARRRARARRRGVLALTAGLVVAALGSVGVAEWQASNRVSSVLASTIGPDAGGESGLQALEKLRAVEQDFGWTQAASRGRRATERLLEVQLDAIRTALDHGDYDAAATRCRDLGDRIDRRDLHATCAELRERAERERGAAEILARADRLGARPTTGDLETLAGLSSGEHLSFHLARLPRVRDHEVRGALLEALLVIDSPRSLEPAARLFVEVRDEGSKRRLRDLLATAARHRAAGRSGEWASVYPELESLMSDPERSVAAGEALELLRGTD